MPIAAGRTKGKKNKIIMRGFPSEKQNFPKDLLLRRRHDFNYKRKKKRQAKFQLNFSQYNFLIGKKTKEPLKNPSRNNYILYNVKKKVSVTTYKRAFV